jgi:alpha-N-arabinofuranosidase
MMHKYVFLLFKIFAMKFLTLAVTCKILTLFWMLSVSITSIHARQGDDIPKLNIATIDVAVTGSPIHPYTYGMFTELLGNIFDHGLWAEMLSDRKFFYPVDTTSNLNPINTRRLQNRWRPVGGDDVVIMDPENSFVGEITPKVTLLGSGEPGMKQTGLGLKKGKKYSGYVVLAGNDALVTVSLEWGPHVDQKESLSFGPLTPEYKKFTFEFTAGEDTDEGSLTITGKGNGYFKVGAVSLMPADNMKGYRDDLIVLLKELNSGIYRWPGGNMLAGYNWRDGIGDRDKRPPRYDYAWNAVESNDVGTDEYLDLCELLDIDPYLVVNIGFGDDFSAAQWVEYVNGDTTTCMGKWRARNGHPEPYEVIWWGIGNEMYGQWQLGHMSIDHYILKHNYFAEAMRRIDPEIKLIASGATPFETGTTSRHHKYPLPFRLPYEYGSDGDWTGKLLMNAADNIDFVAEHLYPWTDHYFDVDSQKFLPVNDPVTDQVRRVPNRVKAVSEAWDHYLEMIPGLDTRNITFALDEWTGGGWRSGFLRTLCAAEGLHEIFRHSDIITMGGYTAVTSCVRFDATDACYSSIGLLFKLYREQLGIIPVNVKGLIPQKPVKGTIGVDMPAEPSGSDTWPLDVFASETEDGRFVTFSVVNPTGSEQELSLAFENIKLKNKVKVFELVPPELTSVNVPGAEPVIIVEERELKKVPDKIHLAPWGIAIYKFEAK